MIQVKFNLEESHIQFLAECDRYGFKNKSSVVRQALDRMKAELERQQMKESAQLYAETYEEDDELQELTEAAISEWPE